MYKIIVQRATKENMPQLKQLKHWAKAALTTQIPSAEVTIRVVNKEEIIDLNYRYRKKNKPTNVLSFSYDMLKEMRHHIPFLGDIVICAEVVNQEAKAQHKLIKAHWAHMIIHGTLHLLGFDHETKKEANVMESLETHILQDLGFANPY